MKQLMIYFCLFPGISGSYHWDATGITILDSTQISSVSDIFFDQNGTMFIVDEYLNFVVWKLLINTNIEPDDIYPKRLRFRCF